MQKQPFEPKQSQQNDDMTTRLYKMIVVYDGTRFNGFQRQIDNNAMNQLFFDNRNSHYYFNKLIPKRPHYEENDDASDNDDVFNNNSKNVDVNDKDRQQQQRLNNKRRVATLKSSGKRKPCTVSIQECIEFAVLDLCNNSCHHGSSNAIIMTKKEQRKRKSELKHNSNDSNQRQDVDNTNNNCNVAQQHEENHAKTQQQPNERFTVDNICLRFAGRTDKGVHANGQVVTVYLPNKVVLSSFHPILQLRKAINSRLPIDISIQHIEQIVQNSNNDDPDAAVSSFDPRRCAKLKVYTYTIKYRRKLCTNNSNRMTSSSLLSGPHIIRNALNDDPCLWVCPWLIDDANIHELCRQLQGCHDYSNFVHKDERNKKSNVMTIDSIQYTMLSEEEQEVSSVPSSSSIVTSNTTHSENNNRIIIVKGQFVLTACGFRRTMVRNIVGYCIDVCRREDGLTQNSSMGHDTKDDSHGNSILWIPSDEIANKINAAPACGLCLESVSY